MVLVYFDHFTVFMIFNIFRSFSSFNVLAVLSISRVFTFSNLQVTNVVVFARKVMTPYLITTRSTDNTAFDHRMLWVRVGEGRRVKGGGRRVEGGGWISLGTEHTIDAHTLHRSLTKLR